MVVGVGDVRQIEKAHARHNDNDGKLHGVVSHPELDRRIVQASRPHQKFVVLILNIWTGPLCPLLVPVILILSPIDNGNHSYTPSRSRHPEKRKSRSMRGPFGFFSKSCSSISNYVQDKVDKAKQKKNTRRNPHQDFLADIDDLNRTIQIRERKEKAGLMRMGKSTKSMAGEAPSDYVSMEEQTAGEQSVENNQQGSKTDTPQDSNQEEDVAFFWELLRFAKNRSWKKKVMT